MQLLNPTCPLKRSLLGAILKDKAHCGEYQKNTRQEALDT